MSQKNMAITEEGEVNPYRLPSDVKPIDYAITLQPDFVSFTFSGDEVITIEIKKPTSRIVLHALDLEIKEASLNHSASGERPVTNISFDKEMQTVILDFEQTLEPGRALLSFNFTGELNDKMHGFYRTSYELNGKTQWGAATQFEATDARRAFPCWDEPAQKAVFSVSLIVPRDLTALSNMPIAHVGRSDPGLKKVTFRPTLLMSTYLVAFVVATLDCVEGTDSNGIPIRVWATPDKAKHGRFALDVELHTLPFFSEWFGVPYAMPKMDLVALPDFAAGAMENWGLVTYRETALLFDPENSAVTARQRVAEVVNHETAHMWFGDLVTMEWWDDLWLNEGFATYMASLATHHQFPEWNIWTQAIADDHMRALSVDSLASTHPVEVSIQNPEEIGEVFDGISYSKGSVVNRMLAVYLGEDDFRKGLNLYLTRHAYGNARTRDLWQALEEASGKPVTEMIEGFTRQPGYPVITFGGYGKGMGERTFSLQQSRFFLDGRKDTENLRWHIPLILATRSGADLISDHMPGRTKNLTIQVKEGDWVKLNPRQSGHYRVAYPQGMWEELAGAIEAGELPAADRLGLLNDAFALARAGYLPTSQALSFIRAFQNETDLDVWTQIGASMGVINNLLSDDPRLRKFHRIARTSFRPLAKRMSWEVNSFDSDTDALLRSLALGALGGYDDTTTIRKAQQRFAQHISGEALNPDLRGVVYSLVAKNGRRDEFQALLRIYNTAMLHEEKMRALRALGNFRDEELIKEFLALTFSERMRAQDAPFVIMATSGHSLGRDLAWQFVKDNWDAFKDRYTGHLLSGILSITAGFITSERLQDVEEFFGSHAVAGTDRMMAQCLERICSNVAWIKRDKDDIVQWIEEV